MPREFCSIQLLRFFAALLVALSHASYFTSPYLESRSIDYYFDFGHSGVHIFFVISGFVMVVSTFRDRPTTSKEFLLHRAIRIFPIYWAYAALYASFNGVPQDWLLSLMLWPGHSGSIIGQGWTLSYEVFFYFCFSMIISLGLLYGSLVLTGSFIVLISVRWLINSGPLTDLVTNPLLLEFIAGMWIAALLKLGVIFDQRTFSAMLVVAVIGFGIGIVVGYSKFPSVISWEYPPP